MNALQRFPIRGRLVGGNTRSVTVITCGEPGCEYTSEVSNAHKAALPNEVVARKFVQRGWFVGRSPSKDRCPKHNLPRPRPDKEAPMSNKQPAVSAAPAPIAEPPREPTRADKRRIIEALDEHYDAGKERYLRAFTDEALAEKLKCPRAWVTSLRDELYGPERNEAAQARDAELVKLEAEAKSLEDRALQLATDAETLRAKIVRARIG